jgi:hypothetical protein
MSKRNSKLRRQKRRTTFVLVSMVGIFAITWLPFNVYNMLLDFAPAVTKVYTTLIPNMDITYTVGLCVQTIAMSSIIANPILYAFLNPQFSTTLKKGLLVLCGWMCGEKFVLCLTAKRKDKQMAIIHNNNSIKHGSTCVQSVYTRVDASVLAKQVCNGHDENGTIRLSPQRQSTSDKHNVDEDNCLLDNVTNDKTRTDMDILL